MSVKLFDALGLTNAAAIVKINDIEQQHTVNNPLFRKTYSHAAVRYGTTRISVPSRACITLQVVVVLFVYLKQINRSNYISHVFDFKFGASPQVVCKRVRRSVLWASCGKMWKSTGRGLHLSHPHATRGCEASQRVAGRPSDVDRVGPVKITCHAG